jgi:hypothetical protein
MSLLDNLFTKGDFQVAVEFAINKHRDHVRNAAKLDRWRELRKLMNKLDATLNNCPAKEI